MGFTWASAAAASRAGIFNFVYSRTRVDSALNECSMFHMAQWCCCIKNRVLQFVYLRLPVMALSSVVTLGGKLEDTPKGSAVQCIDCVALGVRLGQYRSIASAKS